MSDYDFDLFVIGAESALVASVGSETQLTLETSLAGAIAAPTAYEVRHVFSATERVDEYATAASALPAGSVSVWPPEASFDGASATHQNALAAAVAGTLSWSPQHNNPKRSGLAASWSSVLAQGAYSAAVEALPALSGLLALSSDADGRMSIRIAETNNVAQTQDALVNIVAVREMVARRIVSDLQAATIAAGTPTDILREVGLVVASTMDTLRVDTDLSDIGPAFLAYTVDSVAFNDVDPSQVDIAVTLTVSSGFRIFSVTVNATVV